MQKTIVFLMGILFASTALANNKLPQYGLASYYSDFVNGHRTSSGERYCKDSFTAAHRTLPLGTYLKVTNLKNHKSIIVKVNDRGPHRRHRIIDLSGAAACRLDIIRDGLARVKIELALPEEIARQQREITDSLAHDTLLVASQADSFPPDRFMIQGGAFSTLESAEFIKSYLADSCIDKVCIKCTKTVRRHRKRRKIYKVMVGPLNYDEKEHALAILRNKNIKGLVILK